MDRLVPGLTAAIWSGPNPACRSWRASTASFGKAGSLLEQMQATSVVRCDEAGWRFLGVSLAGYNGLVSLALAALALRGAITQARQR